MQGNLYKHPIQMRNLVSYENEGLEEAYLQPIDMMKHKGKWLN